MGQVSEQCKSNMLILARENLTTREIAERLNIPKSTVARNIKKMREMGSTQRKKGSGRPRKTTPVEDRFIILQCRRNRFKTSSDIRQDLERATGKTFQPA